VRREDTKGMKRKERKKKKEEIGQWHGGAWCLNRGPEVKRF